VRDLVLLIRGKRRREDLVRGEEEEGLRKENK